ncbi:unnamed protein product, partial [Allacma fusca]
HWLTFVYVLPIITMLYVMDLMYVNTGEALMLSQAPWCPRLIEINSHLEVSLSFTVVDNAFLVLYSTLGSPETYRANIIQITDSLPSEDRASKSDEGE